MAIDRTGISSLNTGAGEITYSGNEGPKSPDQQLMASADPMLVEEYNKYVFEMEEQGLQPISFKEFVQQIMSGMAEGGIARLGYRFGGHPGASHEGVGSGQTYGGAASGSPHAPGGGGDPAPAVTSTQVAPSRGHDLHAGMKSPPVKTHTTAPGTLSDPREKEDYVTQKWEGPTQLPFGLEIGGGYVDVDPITGERITPPPLQTGGGETRLTPEQLEAIRKQKELEAILASQTIRDEEKEESDAMVAAIKQKEEEDKFLASLALADPSGLETLQYADNRPLQYSAYGGRVPAAYGGIMGNDGRRAYGLGSIFKSVTKPFKKAARAVKKVAKSDLGKLAMMYATYKFAPKMWGEQLGGQGGWGAGWERFAPKFLQEGVFATKTAKDAQTATELLKSQGLKINEENIKWAYDKLATAAGTTAEKQVGSTLGQKALTAAMILGPMAAMKYPNLGATPGPTMTESTAANEAAKNAWLAKANLGLTEEDWQLTPASEFTPLQYSAQGGRIGYAKGGNDEEGHRSAALSAMYGLRKNAQEGGLMNLGGMEKDYRQEGGFVPIGGQERADDVPARLSKNEFVFTADAVRAAGGGDIDKGAEVMENVMENLEQGGNISQESQGLEGARNMFATAQRLEGVL